MSLVPVLGSVGEQKTKPTQHTVKELRSVGLNPDIILCRSAAPLSASTREKLALFCQVPSEAVLTVHDVPNIYHVPLLLESQGVVRIIARKLRLNLFQEPQIDAWRALADIVDSATEEVRIALVGKYTGLQDSYLSVIKALQHAAIAVGRRLLVDWVDATALEAAAEKTDAETYRHSWETVRTADGILVPGGFGDRGVEGKIAAIRHARESKQPFLGICLGMQCAVIEHARTVLGWTGANSAEFDPTSAHPVIVFMPEINPSQMGGTMRLGTRRTLLRGKGERPTIARDIYGKDIKYVWERHRHRYEVNPDAVPALTSAGLVFSGTDDRAQRMEIIELDRAVHPFFFGCQYHPEFQSHPHKPSPPFHGFVLAACGHLDKIPLLGEARDRDRGRAELASPSRRPENATSTAAAPLDDSHAGPRQSLNTSTTSVSTSPLRPVRATTDSSLSATGTAIPDIAPDGAARTLTRPAALEGRQRGSSREER